MIGGVREREKDGVKKEKKEGKEGLLFNGKFKYGLKVMRRYC